MAPAYEGTGVISGSSCREILELVGVHNILTKIKGSKNKNNVVKHEATPELMGKIAQVSYLLDVEEVQ